MIRYYPDPEGTTDHLGVAYPIMAPDQIRPELQNVLDEIKKICHVKDFGLDVVSLNHGQHTTGSNHYRGLAADVNIYRMVSHEWLPFPDQGDLIAEAISNCAYDGWIWVSDEKSHTHFSVKP